MQSLHTYKKSKRAWQSCLKNTDVNVAYITKNTTEANKKYSKHTYGGKGTTYITNLFKITNINIAYTTKADPSGCAA